MNELDFWRQKLIQFFHDPPAKPFSGAKIRKDADGTRLSGKHAQIAKALFDAFQQHNTERKLRHWYKSADWAASGADRPMLYVPRGKSGLGTLKWPKYPEITHPLSPGCRLRIDIREAPPEALDACEAEEAQDAAAEAERDPVAEQQAVVAALAGKVPDWNDDKKLKESFVVLWRRLRDDLVAAGTSGSAQGYEGDALWEEMPAETRCPDHSIWDHLKVTTALAFMRPHKMNEEPEPEAEGAQEPWMLSFSLGPTQAFINQSRTSRDLWISSYLLADLAWHAMEPFVERYGPDCIVYPDLRANPRVDCWLHGKFPEALGDAADDPRRNPSTFAAVLPTKFVALVPRGGDGHLEKIEELAKKAEGKVTKRWKDLAGLVKKWFQRLQGDSAGNNWAAIWERQHANLPLYCTWTAVPWRHMGTIHHPENLMGRALPAQDPNFRQPSGAAAKTAEADRAAIEARRKRLAPWVPIEVWGHYEQARETYARARLDFHQMERGFDYALTHHMLGARHELRKATDPAPTKAEEKGEKCTLCGQREALRGGDGGHQALDKLREQARAFWSHEELDPDETGAERLCAVCAMKRFLVEADQDGGTGAVGGFNRLWVGMNTNFDDVADTDDEVRAPFPSTSTIAAQAFVERVVQGGFEKELSAIVSACKAAALPRTSFPRSLPRLAAVAQAATGVTSAFLKYEAQDVVFPETADGKVSALKAKVDYLKREGKQQEAARVESKVQALSDLKKAVAALRQAASKSEPRILPPSTRIAVIRMDGDHMGRLLLGTDDAIGTRWRDVLHPEIVERLRKNAHLLGAGWAHLLEAKRLMGPALHAFVSRALGHFSHRIVPWVVEREFSGRLIYAGGDDVLCIAPADEALDLAARLQQLFSAPWVIDTQPQEDRDQWAWRRKDWKGEYDQRAARGRFVIPIFPGYDEYGKPRPIRLGTSVEEQPLEGHVAPDAPSPHEITRGTLLPMLGYHASLSAGIAIGHYKTPLSALLTRSQQLLDYAKDPFGDGDGGESTNWHGRRVAIGHASRGGEKTRFALPWASGGAGAPRVDAHATLREVMEAFRTGGLPGRLPYKLRELGLSARCGLERIAAQDASAEEKTAVRKELLEGLFATCLEGDVAPSLRQAAFRLWAQGIRLHERSARCPDEERGQTRDQGESRYTDGLLLCRALASGGDGEEEVE